MKDLVVFRPAEAGSPIPNTSVSSSKLKRKRSAPNVTLASSPSSETEDDSQGMSLLLSMCTTNESWLQAPEPINPFKTPALPVRSKDRARILKQLAAPAPFNILTHDPSTRLTESQRTDTPNAEEASTSRRRSHHWDRSRNSKLDTVSNEGGYGPTDRPVGVTGRQVGIDYSEYKGRGRYARTAQK
jgi:hypothetical protein